MRRGQILLELLLLALAAHGLGSEGLDPWRGWVVFKQFARAVSEAPDPGVSVQITNDEANESVSMVFVRQLVDQVDDWCEPAGGVVCELTFSSGPRRVGDWEAWSFEAASLIDSWIWWRRMDRSKILSLAVHSRAQSGSRRRPRSGHPNER
jgi:hypothetical protein